MEIHILDKYCFPVLDSVSKDYTGSQDLFMYMFKLESQLIILI